MTSAHETAADMVNRPSHYVYGPYECKDIEKAMSDKMLQNPIVTGAKFLPSPYQSRLYFAAFEYLWRAPFKNGVEDLEKCACDLQELIADLKCE